METTFLPFKCVTEVQLVGPGNVVANQIAQITLPGDKADNRDRPISRLCLNEFRQLLCLLMNETQVGCVAGQPENQLIQKQDEPVVAESRRMSADD